MAYLKLYRNKLQHNYKMLNKMMLKEKKDFGIVTKLLCGNKTFIEEVINLGTHQICDSRLSNLKAVKQINRKTETMYIKPPAAKNVKSVVQYADISLNTSLDTIKLLAREAKTQKKIHKVIIMVEMGDLREGVLGHKLIDFYKKVFKLKGIKVIGLGTNLNCLHGVMPSGSILDKKCFAFHYHKILNTLFQVLQSQCSFDKGHRRS